MTAKRPRPIDRTAIERMVLARGLFRDGMRAASNRRDPFEFSRGIMALQDAVELALGAAATQAGAVLKPKTHFAGYFDSINDKVGAGKLPYYAELLRLNDARVKVKHHGILQKPEDHQVAVESVEPFLRHISRTFFQKEFESISLLDSIRNPKISEPIKTALKFREARNARGCVEALARARFEITQLRFTDLLARALTQNAPADGVYWEKFDSTRDGIWLLEHGIDVSGFYRFSAILPALGWDQPKKELKFWWGEEHCHEGNWTDEHLDWCVEFVTDMAFKIERDTGLPDLIHGVRFLEHTVTALKDEVSVWNHILDDFVVKRLLLLGGPVVEQVSLLKLKKGEAITGYAYQDREKLSEWRIHSSDIPGGSGVVLAADVEISRALRSV